MANQIQEVELIPDTFNNPQTNQNPVENPVSKSWFRAHRLLVFMLVFLISLLLGLIIVFIRPPIYLSKATLLTVAPTALDQRSSEADVQHVIIQKQILTGQPLLERTLERLRNPESFESASGSEADVQHVVIQKQILTGEPLLEKTLEQPAFAETNLSVDDLRAMLTVIPIEETNLVELHAEGSDPSLLQNAINSLLKVYTQVRAEFINETTGALHEKLNKELQNFEDKVQAKREELEEFRQNNEILSTVPEDNRARARLKGLNDSLNLASEEEVKAKAHLAAVQMAIARGDAVVPQDESRSLANMQQRAQELRERNAEINRMYTPAYIKIRPELRIVGEQLAKLETQIDAKLLNGREYVLSEAKVDYEAAKESLARIKSQLDEHKLQASEFTTQFSKYEALQEDLLATEESYRLTQQRLTDLEVKQMEEYPQVDVVDWAFLPVDPIRPDYMQDAGIALAISVLLGLMAVWLAEFLTRQEVQQSAITLSGIHLYNGRDARPKEIPNKQHAAQIAKDSVQSLEQQFPRELSFEEVKQLIHSANAEIGQLLLLLLSGLTLDEAILLNANNIDLKNNEISLAPADDRTITLSPALRSNIEQLGVFPAWLNESIESLDDLKALISYTAIDSGIPHPEDLTAESLRHTYILFLVRQGVRLSELNRIIGPVSPLNLVRYGQYSPDGTGIPVDEIDLVYPLGPEN